MGPKRCAKYAKTCVLAGLAYRFGPTMQNANALPNLILSARRPPEYSLGSMQTDVFLIAIFMCCRVVRIVYVCIQLLDITQTVIVCKML